LALRLISTIQIWCPSTCRQNAAEAGAKLIDQINMPIEHNLNRDFNTCRSISNVASIFITLKWWTTRTDCIPNTLVKFSNARLSSFIVAVAAVVVLVLACAVHAAVLSAAAVFLVLVPVAFAVVVAGRVVVRVLDLPVVAIAAPADLAVPAAGVLAVVAADVLEFAAADFLLGYADIVDVLGFAVVAAVAVVVAA
jgi:hypothetical protein